MAKNEYAGLAELPRPAIERLMSRCELALRPPVEGRAWGDVTDAEWVHQVCRELLFARQEIERLRQAAWDAAKALGYGRDPRK